MTLTNKLKQLMNERGLTKADVSRGAGLPYTTVDGLFKKDTENVKLSTLKALATFFECTIDSLVDSTSSISNDIEIYSDHQANLAYFANKPELLEIYKEIHESENHKLLFDSARDLAPEDLEYVLNLIKRLKDSEG